ncbi:hypothetical protein AA23498_1836 [Acetobacter nitrogenifigens DSM 23921 = NBRC 105050]|uniref:Uncharacterized protein n=1 Tax=Acetobacter nitrogenifigens DSM 23921 = NBRC 105050 TaxID=1120919 RepID=A0A511X9P6_9PROT|nr:hypothetical protein [Acetobacter nitrogenifigens]GBQ93799.1 hypothetical protein AA23498_1836 [Acetobacter nitrogenifigens DSM 23921 = NBRC 105050]GEN59676.1 hypothetical protein ANI02nite_15600 [Acetobacter nitrogenifigens DSM 23921 = NBRC 105050]
MSTERRSDPPDPKSVVQGMALLASGRAEGLNRFRGSADSFLAAIAPGVAINLVSLLLVTMQDHVAIGLTKVELSFCALLAPPVISNFFARRWGREDLWLRYATAAAWCEWVSVFVSVVALAIASLFAPALVHTPSFVQAVVAAAELYGVWLGWFVAKVGLRLSWGKALVVYGASVVFALICYGLASVFPPHYSFIADLLKPMVVSQAN